MSTKTTWEDLARMGAPRRQVFLTLNPLRGNTMANESHMHLNNSFVEQYGWYCYNMITGNPVLVGSAPIDASGTTIVYTWDNTQNNQPWEETRTESFTRTTTTSLSNTTSASITIEQSVTIGNVASSGISLSIGTESNSTVSEVISEEQTAEFRVVVQPGEKLELLRTRTELGLTATYRVPYGIRGMIGTQGNRWNGHYHWGFGTGHLNSNLSGHYDIQGVHRQINFNFTIRRTQGSGLPRSTAVYISPLGPEYNAKLDIEDEETPHEPDGPRQPRGGEMEVVPGY